MKKRNPFVVILLTLVTLGIYGVVWHVKTKNDMNRLGATIPTAWLIIVPFVNIWWLWKYSEGVERVTNNKVSTILSFVLLFLLGIIGSAILQYEFNKVGDQAAPTPAEPLTTAAPGFGAPVAPSTPTTNNAAPSQAPVPEAPAEPAAVPSESESQQPQL